MTHMNDEPRNDDLEWLIEEGVLATLATYGADGTVRLSPVWCEWVNGGFNVVVANGDVKARHLKRDGRVSLVAYTNKTPYRGVEIRTRAVLTTEGAVEVEHRLAHRYLAAAKAEAYLASTTWSPLLVRLEPGELRTWDYSGSGL